MFNYLSVAYFVILNWKATEAFSKLVCIGAYKALYVLLISLNFAN